MLRGCWGYHTCYIFVRFGGDLEGRKGAGGGDFAPLTGLGLGLRFGLTPLIVKLGGGRRRHDQILKADRVRVRVRVRVRLRHLDPVSVEVQASQRPPKAVVFARPFQRHVLASQHGRGNQ